MLDFVPAVVNRTQQTASKINTGVRSTASQAVQNVSSYIDSYFGNIITYGKNKLNWSMSTLIEEGKNINVQCYSLTCEPGRLCYSPTCVRSKNYEWLSKDALKDVIKGLYSTTTARFAMKSDSNTKDERVRVVTLKPSCGLIELNEG
jgi:hypothetical protein